MKDHIRERAEQEVGPIPDEAWTPELRAAWKAWLHAENYGASFCRGRTPPDLKLRTVRATKRSAP